MRRAIAVMVPAVLVTLITGCGATRGGGHASQVTVPPTSATTGLPGPHTTTTTTAPTPPNFAWKSDALDTATRALMVGATWHPGCPVGLDSLRLVTLSYWGFDSSVHEGQLVVNADSVTPVVSAFRALYQSRFPIRLMRLADYYRGDDESSMAADNSSAFNCRLVPGTDVWSQHAYGRAVDIDPRENPEIQGGQVDPPSASPWADRDRSDPAMIRHGDAAWQAFIAVGWKWGGDWTSLQDYMHFSANGL